MTIFNSYGFVYRRVSSWGFRHSEIDWQSWWLCRVCFEDHHSQELWSAQSALKEPTGNRHVQKNTNASLRRKWLFDNHLFWKTLGWMVSHFHIIFLAIDLQRTYAWWCEMYCQKRWKEKEEQHAKALEACLKCGYHVDPAVWGSFRDSAIQRTASRVRSQRTKKSTWFTAAAVLRYSIYMLQSDSCSYRFDFASHGLQDLRTRQLGEHSENLQAWTGVFL